MADVVVKGVRQSDGRKVRVSGTDDAVRSDLSSIVSGDLGAANGIATLDGSALVVQNPASAQIAPAFNAIPVRDTNGDVIVPSSPSSSTAATSRSYVDELVAKGRSWKEILLVMEQLEPGSSGGINQGFLAGIAVDLAVGDTFIITDGVVGGGLGETFTAVGAAPSAFEFIAAAGIAATTANLVAAINTDSTLWGSVVTTGLDTYFSTPLTTSFVVHRSTPVPLLTIDRAYGVIANAQSDLQVIQFGSALDYSSLSGTQADLSATDPAVQYAGITRLLAGLTAGETHRTAESNAAYTWDADDEVWQQTSMPQSFNPAKGSAPYAASAPDYAEANALLPAVGDYGYFLKGATDPVFHLFRRSVVASTLADFAIVEMT
jgi:hypothetical protein